MKLSDYLLDKLYLIVLSLFSYFIILIIILLSKVNYYLIILITIMYFLPIIVYLIIDYLIRKKYYCQVFNILNNIDQKYFLNEIIDQNEFVDAKLINNILYEIDKNYIEHLKQIKKLNTDYKDYIETWTHEIKTPIATTKLIIENNKNKVTSSISEELDRIEYLVEQILFYARMDTLEEDYVINSVNIKELINNVIKNNKKAILNKHIKLNLSLEDTYVETDSKWLEFILNQIVSNSIKYSKENPEISFIIKENPNNTIITIIDNGIGISRNDLGRIFDKGFTGSTGRKYHESTGIGLYLANKLCCSLGHSLTITSKLGEGTTAYIVIPKNSTLNVIK